MTSKELYLKLNDLSKKDHAKLLISSRYICDFVDCLDDVETYCYFTEAFKDNNSGAMMTYADLHVYDTIELKKYYGRLYCVVCDDLVGENKYSYMLYLKEPQSTLLACKDYNKWLSSITISAQSIDIMPLANDVVI